MATKTDQQSSNEIFPFQNPISCLFQLPSYWCFILIPLLPAICFLYLSLMHSSNMNSRHFNFPRDSKVNNIQSVTSHNCGYWVRQIWEVLLDNLWFLPLLKFKQKTGHFTISEKEFHKNMNVVWIFCKRNRGEYVNYTVVILSTPSPHWLYFPKCLSWTFP